MKELRIADLRDKSMNELHEELEHLHQDRFKLRMQQSSGQNSHFDRYGKLRRGIARVKTLIRQKQEGVGHG